MRRRAGARVAVLAVPLAAALSVSTAFEGAGPACFRVKDSRRTSFSCAFSCSERAVFSRPLMWQQGLGICRARDGHVTRDGCFSRLFASARPDRGRAGAAAQSSEAGEGLERGVTQAHRGVKVGFSRFPEIAATRRQRSAILSPAPVATPTAPVATPKTSKWLVMKKAQQYNVTATAKNIVTRSRTKSGVQREFNNEISRLGKEGRWQEALQMLEEMEKAGFKATVVSYNAAMSSLNKNGQAGQALGLFDRVFSPFTHLPADSFSYATALSACIKTRNWQRVFALFDRMEGEGIEANAYHYRLATR
jgi:pentatricopeptide repeat protein